MSAFELNVENRKPGKLAIFQPVGGRAPLDPYLACTLRQVLEIRDSDEILFVDDPCGNTLGYVRWNENPIPVLDPVRWGSPGKAMGSRQRLVLVRGATATKVLAIPIQQFWIESLEGAGDGRVRALSVPGLVWKTRCLALIHAPFGEALLLDVDALFRSLVA